LPIITVSSSFWSGAVPLETAWNCQEVTSSQDGNRYTMNGQLERVGFLGCTPALYESLPIAAHFELHIEQGPILEDERRKIGIVSGSKWLFKVETVTLAQRPWQQKETFPSRCCQDDC
jgi:hypothetical protein